MFAVVVMYKDKGWVCGTELALGRRLRELQGIKNSNKAVQTVMQSKSRVWERKKEERSMFGEKGK